jgi:acetyl-CoA carboxylase biotin carboxyl carrier protein
MRGGRDEMIASVMRVLAGEGEFIAEGDTLVLPESMKMEIPVLAEVSGIVSGAACDEGGVVQEGDLILAIE